jgi:uncharacterized protein (TIGR00255 family)
MSVFSMTGYAGRLLEVGTDQNAESAGLPSRVGMEIRSINSRFLDLSFRMPDEWRTLEPALREQVQAHIKRGKVEIRMWREETGSQVAGMPPQASLQKLAHLQDQIMTWFPDAAPLAVAEVMRLASTTAPTRHTSAEAVVGLVKDVLNALKLSRAQEGERLSAMLQDCCRQIRRLADSARPLVQLAVQQHQERFLSRWQEALAMGEAFTGAALSDEAKTDRALTEAAAFAIRVDIAEELTRLHSHVDEIEVLLRKGGELGKRLDFLIQELHREANTLGSKAQSIALTRVSVDMKVLIEQMREQVQNIE